MSSRSVVGIPGACAIAPLDGSSERLEKPESAPQVHDIGLRGGDSALSLLAERVPVILALDSNGDRGPYTMKLILRAHAYVPAIQILALTDSEEGDESAKSVIVSGLLSSTAPRKAFGPLIVKRLVNYETKRQELRGCPRLHRPDLVDYMEFWLVAWIAKRVGVEPRGIDRTVPLFPLLVYVRSRTRLATDYSEVGGSAVPRDILETCNSLRDSAEAPVEPSRGMVAILSSSAGRSARTLRYVGCPTLLYDRTVKSNTTAHRDAAELGFVTPPELSVLGTIVSTSGMRVDHFSIGPISVPASESPISRTTRFFDVPAGSVLHIQVANFGETPATVWVYRD